MRIVYFIDHLRPDGAQAMLVQLIEGLAKRDHEQKVICLNDSWDEFVLKRLIEVGAEVKIVGKLHMATGLGGLSVLRWLHDWKCDVAVTMLFVSDFAGRFLSRLAGISRVVTSIQTRDEFYSGMQRWLVRLTMRWADVVVLCSALIRDFAITQEGTNPDRILIIPNTISVDTNIQPLSREVIHHELGLSIDSYLIGGVGRLVRQKGFDILLQALAQVSNLDIHLLIAGVGEQEQQLRELAASLGLDQHVHFTGYRRDVPQILGALDLYIQPSRFEGMPIAVLEAMASGCAIIASAVDGNRELIEDGVHGWLVPAEDPARLAEAIREALANPEEGWRRGAAAKRRVQAQFSTEVMIATWEAVLAGRLVPGNAQGPAVFPERKGEVA